MSKVRVGVVGYGSLGKFLVDHILHDKNTSSKCDLAFVWNRSPKTLKDSKAVPEHLILEDLNHFEQYKPTLIVEVAHPTITKLYSHRFISYCDYLIGSPTAFADKELESTLQEVCKDPKSHGIYIPRGALWGVHDIHSMAKRGSLTGLALTMKFHPDSLKLVGELERKLMEVKEKEGEQVLYEGPLRPLCSLAPNNVNTMACAALAGFTVGFDKTQATLISNKMLHAHIVEIVVYGPDKGDLGRFSVTTQRVNPSAPGAVTGQATFMSFLNSMLEAGGKTNGFHFC